ncbi:sulfatase-like hydrolase/transferase [Acidovorax sp. HDW3]|uniref:sulfatase-like hydrolase/transferase n=1 Tax=Acidovorax sp. HDW3 TaxID=2714923 RepID=UPI00140DAEFF|nr:sulfatase-like hydrolase/transferase [Acidovorax sp. HDW3]QIL42902.1 sulfatase-like hydrolase/transferase [Acidovorax sp. HDW3]
MSLSFLRPRQGAVPLWQLALVWWFLCSPVLWMWPGGRSLLDTVVSALLLAPVFLWRRAVPWVAALLVLIGAAYLGYFFAVRSAPDEFFWFTLLGSNPQEALEYAGSYRWQALLQLLAWALPALWLVGWLARRTPALQRRWARALLMVLALLWPLWAAVAVTKGYSVEEALRKANRIYPLALFETLARQQTAAAQVFKVPPVAPPTAPARADLIVLVIGESASAQRWSLLGYGGHDTNAALRPLPGLQVLPVLSNGNNTAQTVPLLLSGQALAQLPAQGLVTYLDWARAAGFHTVTLSNQTTSGTAETFFHAAYRQRSAQYLALPAGSFDEALTAPLAQALAQHAQAPLLVTVHTYGSHPRVAGRTPPARAHWDDPYDNSQAYTSELLAEWIGLLQQQAPGRRSLLLYISDHGLNLTDCGGQYTHGSAPSAYEVPLLLWANPAFAQAQPEWMAALAAHAQASADGLPRYDNRVFPATVADLLGYHLPYPSLGAGQQPPEPQFAGQPYRQLRQQPSCDLSIVPTVSTVRP